MLPSDLECSRDASHRYSAAELATVCPQDGAPLLVRYGAEFMPLDLCQERECTMWRYREMLPIDTLEEPITLGEGATPLLRLRRLERELGIDELYVKDESQNPTGSFKARGMSVAVTVARRLGAMKFVAPSAGNAGGALAAYGARAGVPVRVYVPRDTPAVLIEEMQAYGAEVVLVDGLIDDAGRLAAGYANESGAFNLATFREPYRVEGKKTMGYELVEHLGRVPGTIVYPTGGGTGLVAMWKALDELERLGWIGAERPAMIAVQAEGCAPIVRAFERGDESATRAEHAATRLWGLRVPGGIGDRLTLRALRESGGAAVAVSDEAAVEATRDLHRREGIDACVEGGATLAALRALVRGSATLAAPLVLFNTGTSLKYGPQRG
ncbi:MAG: threonine synthase [Candidatus Eremiobacteraeota bacterium]|nr:threonine synthase [Candidatus Eremiobacteraeota bacterium]